MWFSFFVVKVWGVECLFVISLTLSGQHTLSVAFKTLCNWTLLHNIIILKTFQLKPCFLGTADIDLVESRTHLSHFKIVVSQNLLNNFLCLDEWSLMTLPSPCSWYAPHLQSLLVMPCVDFRLKTFQSSFCALEIRSWGKILVILTNWKVFPWSHQKKEEGAHW